MTGAIRTIDLLRVGSSSADRRCDRVAAEEPLEIRLCGTPLLVTMRTPGRDRDLVAGLRRLQGGQPLRPRVASGSPPAEVVDLTKRLEGNRR